MKLTQVDITNFRCFERLIVPLQPDVNVFVGVNASGKTALLDAIAIALYDIVAEHSGGEEDQRDAQGVNLSPSDIHIRPGSREPVSGREWFVEIRTQAGSYYAPPDFKTLAQPGQHITWKKRISYSPPNTFEYSTSRSPEWTDLGHYFERLWREIRRSDPKTLIPLPVVAYYRTHRHLQGMPKMGDIFQAKLERHDAFQRALNAGANYQAMCQWFYLRENRELREQRNDRDFEFPDLRAVRQAISKTLEHVERIFFDDSPPRLKVEFATPGESPRVFALEQLSDGYRNLLAVVLDFARRLAQANPNWDNPLQAPGILLIDEIELHLHPGWQQSIIPNLRKVFPNTQLILATHSPQVLTTVRKEHVRCLTAQHTLEPLPADIGTYGSESSFALEMVFGVHTRPKMTVETVGKLEEYLRLVEARQYASKEAQKLRAELEDDLGTSDPSLTRADMRIRQLEILAQRR